MLSAAPWPPGVQPRALVPLLRQGVRPLAEPSAGSLAEGCMAVLRRLRAGQESSLVPSSDVRVPFRFAGLRRLLATGGVLAVGGIGMAVSPVDLLGVPIPRSVAVITGTVGIVLGGWFLVAAIRRWGAEDPAIEMRPGQLWLHANPGRRITLEAAEVRGVAEPVPSRGMQRFILGDSSIRVRTTRPEGFFASDVLIGQAFVAEPLEDVAQRLQTWLRSSGKGQDPQGY